MNNEMLFSFLARRIGGPAFAIGGAFLSLSSIDILLPGGTVMMDGVPTDDIVLRAFAVLFPGVIAVLGVAMSLSKPITHENLGKGIGPIFGEIEPQEPPDKNQPEP